MHLLRCEEDFFPAFLFPWIIQNQESPLYQDTNVYLKNGKLVTNRLVIRLIFPDFRYIDSFNQCDNLDVFMNDWELEDFQTILSSFLVNKKQDIEDIKDNDNDEYVDLFATDDEDEVKHEKETKVNTENENILTKIQKRHKSKKSTWQCYDCNINFKFMEELKEHAEQNHDLEKFLRCQFCEFRTTRNKSLKRHENIHTREVEYPCHICAKLV